MPATAPTPEQCSATAPVAAGDGRQGVACWYPSMGGYAGRAIIIPDGDGCFDVLVWHDGEFPFLDGDSPPKDLHHCTPDEFIRFGELAQRVILQPPVPG